MSSIPIIPLRLDPKRFNPSCPIEDSLAIQEVLKNRYSSFGGCANIVYYCLSSEAYQKSTHLACHAILARLSRKEMGVALGTENAARRKLGGDYVDLTAPFLNWFLYESHYGQIIVNRHDLEFCRDYGFVMSTRVPAALLLNACIASRHFNECVPLAFERFNYLVLEKGIDPYLAYNYAFNSHLSSNYGAAALDDKWEPYTGHRVCNAPSLADAIHWYQGQPRRASSANSETMLEYGSIYGCSDQFYDSREQSFGREADILKLLIEYRVKSESSAPTDYRPPNPFSPDIRHKQVKRVEDFSYREAEEVILPHYDKIIRQTIGGLRAAA